jgi:hypothetical protein
MLRSKYRKSTKFSYKYEKDSNVSDLKLIESIESYKSYENGKFEFLNLSHKFDKKIDWNYLAHGKLWAYNLNYFEYLNQQEMDIEVALEIIDDFIKNIETNKEGLEPFPISLRAINWIKFLIYNEIKEKSIDDSLYAQYYILSDNLEYHLLGNHLLENGFALLFGAYYFNDELLYKRAKDILKRELKEQILNDGAHFELSPMYHQLMLFRILECINLVKNNEIFNHELEEFLVNYAHNMLSWLDQMSYKDGSIPHFNDATDNIAPTTNQLFDYAQRLGLSLSDKIPLKESGYRVYDKANYELRVDVGEIGPSYIPGHAHSDTFNFELRVNGKPFIVDTGISTYESNQERLKQRRTSSHNSVMIDDIDQSKVWSSFRVAERAHIIELKESEDSVEASHDGYRRLGFMHKRKFFVTDKSIQIKDLLVGKSDSDHQHTAYIHFHPDIKDIIVKKDRVIIKNIILYIKGSKNLQLDDFNFANGFNSVKIAKVLKITFDNELLVEIVFD